MRHFRNFLPSKNRKRFCSTKGQKLENNLSQQKVDISSFNPLSKLVLCRCSLEIERDAACWWSTAEDKMEDGPGEERGDPKLRAKRLGSRSN